jgi:uncharacterized protein
MIHELLSSKGIRIFLVIVGVLFAIPLLINYSQRSERLASAILNGRDEEAKILLMAHPELLNKPDGGNGFTPLHWAVIKDRTNLVEWLVARGAAVDAADPMGMTPLHKAAVFNRVRCAEMLLAKGAKIDPLARKYGALRLAPIHLAAEEGRNDMVKCLLQHGADVNTPTEGANRITPLHFAAARGRAAVLETLIAAGADINMKDFAGKTPLTWAIESGQKDAADMLREAGAVP